jgi:hypothetical protein
MFALPVLVAAAMSTILCGVIRQSEVLDGKPHITALVGG